MAAYGMIESMSNIDAKAQKGIVWLIVIGAIVLVGLAFWAVLVKVQDMSRTVVLGGETYRAEVVDTFEARAKGLSDRPSIDSNRAMLFVFSEDDFHAIWMKDMQFAIDVVWLDSDKRVVHVKRNVQPDEPPHASYTPVKKARYVLEVGAGRAAKVAIGETMVIRGGGL